MSETHTAAEDVSMYDRIGGAITIDRLVETFYARMDELEEARGIRALHADDLGETKAVLKRYLSEWTGGPKLYTPQKGHPRLRQRHLHIPIGESERDAWLLCMHGALAQTVQDAAARQDLYDTMAKLADWMRNSTGNPHDTTRGTHASRHAAGHTTPGAPPDNGPYVGKA